jgi:ubiquinone/menaquinone biosynthesis C-methylase UbiE
MADAAFWDRIAEGYAQKKVANPEAFERKIKITQSHMKSDHVILDIGCGTGSLALRLASSAAQVHGLDLSGEMIRIARQKAEAQKADNVTFHVGPFDASFAALGPESLDGLCAYSILHLVDDLADALRRIHQLLKPGGFFISSNVCLGESWIPMGPMIKLMHWVGKAPRVLILSKPQMKAALSEAGFVNLQELDVGADSTTAFLVAQKAH